MNEVATALFMSAPLWVDKVDSNRRSCNSTLDECTSFRCGQRAQKECASTKSDIRNAYFQLGLQLKGGDNIKLITTGQGRVSH